MSLYTNAVPFSPLVNGPNSATIELAVVGYFGLPLSVPLLAGQTVQPTASNS